MAKSMAVALSDHTKKTITEAQYFSVSADKETTNDHEGCDSIGLVTFGGRDWCACCKRCIYDGVTMEDYIHDHQIREKFVCFGADGFSVFQGSRAGVMTQFREQVVLFLLGVHCMAHRTNLAVEPCPICRWCLSWKYFVN